MMWKANRTVFLPMLRHESSSTDHLYIDTLRSADTVGRRIQFCNCLKVNLNEEKRTKMTSPDCFLSSDMWLNTYLSFCIFLFRLFVKAVAAPLD